MTKMAGLFCSFLIRYGKAMRTSGLDPFPCWFMCIISGVSVRRSVFECACPTRQWLANMRVWWLYLFTWSKIVTCLKRCPYLFLIHIITANSIIHEWIESFAIFGKCKAQFVGFWCFCVVYSHTYTSGNIINDNERTKLTSYRNISHFML